MNKELPETADVWCDDISDKLKKFCFETDLYISISDMNLNSIEQTGEINITFKKKMKENNPKYIEYWKKVMPDKSDEELEQYRVKWGKENPKYLKFPNL